MPVRLRRWISAGQSPSNSIRARGAGAAPGAGVVDGASGAGAARVGIGVAFTGGAAFVAPAPADSPGRRYEIIRNTVIVKPAYSSGARARSRRPRSAIW